MSVDDYFDAAIELLVTEGPGSIKVGSLCAAVGVTTGSFYGYFGSLDEFVEKLLISRLSRPNHRLVALAGSDEEPELIVTQLRALLDDVPHDAETALRAWASSHPRVATLQQRLDQERGAALAAILDKIVPPAESRRLTEVAMALLIGYQQLYADAAVNHRDSMFDQFESMVWAHSNVPTNVAWRCDKCACR